MADSRQASTSSVPGGDLSNGLSAPSDMEELRRQMEEWRIIAEKMEEGWAITSDLENDKKEEMEAAEETLKNLEQELSKLKEDNASETTRRNGYLDTAQERHKKEIAAATIERELADAAAVKSAQAIALRDKSKQALTDEQNEHGKTKAAHTKKEEEVAALGKEVDNLKTTLNASLEQNNRIRQILGVLVREQETGQKLIVVVKPEEDAETHSKAPAVSNGEAGGSKKATPASVIQANHRASTGAKRPQASSTGESSSQSLSLESLPGPSSLVQQHNPSSMVERDESANEENEQDRSVDEAVIDPVRDESSIARQDGQHGSDDDVEIIHTTFDELFNDVVAIEADPGGTSLLNYKGIVVLFSDLEKVEKKSMANDIIIDVYLTILKDRILTDAMKQTTHMFSCLFWTSLTKGMKDNTNNYLRENNGRIRFESVAKNYPSAKKLLKGVDIFTMDYLVIPIHEEAAQHWHLAIVLFPSRCIVRQGQTNLEAMRMGFFRADAPPTFMLMLDSLIDNDNPMRQATSDIIRDFLEMEYTMRGLNDGTFFDRSLIEPLRPCDLPQQEDEYNCGYYLLKFAETILKDPPIQEEKLHRKACWYGMWYQLYPNISPPEVRRKVAEEIEKVVKEKGDLEKWRAYVQYRGDGADQSVKSEDLPSTSGSMMDEGTDSGAPPHKKPKVDDVAASTAGTSQQPPVGLTRGQQSLIRDHYYQSPKEQKRRVEQAERRQLRNPTKPEPLLEALQLLQQDNHAAQQPQQPQQQGERRQPSRRRQQYHDNDGAGPSGWRQ